MIELPPELKAIAWFQSGLSRQQCVERAFDVLVKAGWHSKQECISNKESVKEWLKLNGWRSPEDWQKARQQLKKKLDQAKDKYLVIYKYQINEIVDEVLK